MNPERHLAGKVHGMGAPGSPFTNRKVCLERLPGFGFSRRNGLYAYSTPLLGGQFVMTVTVTKKGIVTAEVIDGASGETYVLHRVSGARGPFASRVREEYLATLNAISAACCEPDVFRSEGAARVVRHVRERYGDEPEFLWPRSPRNAIFRRRDNGKWYAALLTVEREKIGLRGKETVEILDLRMEPDALAALVDGKKYFPGYHMNKKHWFTLCLDGTVPQEEILSLIAGSFAIAARK